MALKNFMNVRIADLAVLYIKLHRFHWFVEGSDFYPVHEKMQELYEETTELLDEFAERLLAIGGAPAATLKEYLALTVLSEEGSEVTPKDIYTTLAKDYGLISEALKEGVGIAQEEGDEATADLFIGTITTLEKHMWMFKQSVK